LVDANVSPPGAPSHVDEAIRSIVDLQAEHEENATTLERGAAWVTDHLSRAWFLCALSIAVVGWVGCNLLVSSLDRRPIDPPPFPWLEAAVSLLSLYMVTLVLITQRRDERLARRQALLALEMSLLNEQKSAKVIELLEELRRDSPIMQDRVDHRAAAMSEPADPRTMLDAISNVHESLRDDAAQR
jgi:uncharacterized membrane protein